MITKVFDSSSSNFSERESAKNSVKDKCTRLAGIFMEKHEEDLVIFEEEYIGGSTCGTAVYNGRGFDAKGSMKFVFCTRKEMKKINEEKNIDDRQDKFISLIEKHGPETMERLLDKFNKIGKDVNLKKMDIS